MENEHVLRLDVAMDDAALVGRLEHVEQIVRDPNRQHRIEPLGVGLQHAVERLAREKVHDQEVDPVVRHVIVEHRDCARMVHFVGDVALLEKALDDLGVRGKRRQEHLDGAFVSVTMRRRVDGGHPPDAKDGVDAPLAANHAADAGVDGVVERGLDLVDVGRIRCHQTRPV